ncbi:polysaccharide pyruvyl transferase family protein [Carnobacterium maltaromaticum]|uniref:polysaccharide pyruvyl transferase family protein n=1 Tax=Carnobacterium maltaromaticum TaxID=2751 RepID=UPI00295EC8F0|nr:polysaccharide pyruvyl transferase family protein [Carnobacterium maltaromaticum]
MIDYAVPLNNGDAALIFALGDELETLGHEVTYSTFQLDKVKKKYPEKVWIASILSNKYLNHIPIIRYIYYCIQILCNPVIKNQDLIIAAPGGYINSYYGFKLKLLVLSLYKRLLGKPIIMYSQSIGPLNRKDEKIIKKYLPYFSKFLVRDEASFQRIKPLTGNYESLVKTYDAAFLMEPKGQLLKSSTKKIAISVRSWKFDNRSQDIYQQLIKDMVKELIFHGFEIVFLSTCQGDTEYIDDSIEAIRIYRSFPKKMQESITIDANNYDLDQLKERLQEFDYVIGTRLHMCILAWLSGVPAFNISYEEKGKECYSYLGLEKYTIDYNEEDNSRERIKSFLKMTEIEKQCHFNKIDTIHVEMKRMLGTLLNESGILS